MSVQAVRNRFDTVRNKLGKQTLNTLFPKDFEFYLISFELINSKGFTEDFFTFPVTPSSIKETQPYLSNVRKTSSSVNVVNTDTFVPGDIVLQGNFGREFKTLINRNIVSFSGVLFTVLNGGLSGLVDNVSGAQNLYTPFDTQVKTGYGCLKVLESIIRRSKRKDPYGSPYRLVLYNPASGNDYIVEVMNFTQSQDNETNAIWNYTLEMKSVAPLQQIRFSELEKSLTSKLSIENVSRGIDSSISRLGRLL